MLIIVGAEQVDELRIKEKTLYFFKAKYEGTIKLDKKELTEYKEMRWKEFFNRYKDEEIGHGLRYLRKKIFLKLIKNKNPCV